MNRSTQKIKRFVALAAVVALSLTAAGKRYQYSPQEKAAYADAATVEFVQPGLVITINSGADRLRRDDHRGVHVDRPEWSSSGCCRRHDTRSDQPGIHRGGVAEQPGRLHGVHDPRQFGTGGLVDQSAGPRFRRRDYRRTGPISVRLPHEGAGRVRCDRHPHHRHLCVPRADRLQSGHQLCQRDLQLRSQWRQGNQGSRRHQNRELQYLSRSAFVARRAAARRRDVRAVPHPAKCGHDHRGLA